MYWNTIFYISNITGFSKAYDALLNLPALDGSFGKSSDMFDLLFSNPTSCQGNFKFGPVYRAEENESGAEFAARVKIDFVKFLKTENPGGLNYTRRENIPLDKDARILFIGYHSNHNWDIAVSGMSIRNIMNEVPVGLMHRTVVAWCPWVKSFGCIAGTRSSAINAYKRGHRACMVIPGGAEEAKSSKGHLRTGFAQLAMEADAVIIPVVVENLQEMVFNPLFFLLNVTWFSKAYNYLIDLPGWIGWLFLQIKMYTWMWFSMLPVIPMPVKSGVIFGTPLHHEKDETVEHYAIRVSHEYEKLVHQTNPGGLNYTRALRARFNN
ncbi:hypothetical protein THRCLA_00032 [Thraustotheca clavata]|uniref:Acyltransferase n=1 Tax=Thraustotheca clavata TaxID=74557 RepID=A0A1W0ACG9_9STRA|nr:hypothetical protein THRCLA_00032 [Thraustotheca clavata]